MPTVTYGNADLLLKIRSDQDVRQQIRKVVVLSGVPQHLRPRGRVWLTTGACNETVGYFDLASQPRSGPGVLSFPGKTNPARGNAGLLQVKAGSLRIDRRPVRLETGAGRPHVAGSFVYVRPERTELTVLLNPNAVARGPEIVTTRLLGSGNRTPLEWDAVPSRESLRPKAEERLQRDYVNFLGAGRRWRRWLFRVDNRTATLNDLWDDSLQALIEVKGSSERAAVRMAVGTLLDHRQALTTAQTATDRRGIKAVDPLLAVLLPRRPESELLTMLADLGIGCIWKIRGGFDDNANGLFLQRNSPTRLGRKANSWRGP